MAAYGPMKMGEMIIFQYDNMTSNIGWYSHHLHSFTFIYIIHKCSPWHSSLIQAHPRHPQRHSVSMSASLCAVVFRVFAPSRPDKADTNDDLVSNHGPLGMWSGWDQLDPVVTGLRWFHVLFHVLRSAGSPAAAGIFF